MKVVLAKLLSGELIMGQAYLDAEGDEYIKKAYIVQMRMKQSNHIEMSFSSMFAPISPDKDFELSVSKTIAYTTNIHKNAVDAYLQAISDIRKPTPVETQQIAKGSMSGLIKLK